jgi:hypothetical protein
MKKLSLLFLKISKSKINLIGFFNLHKVSSFKWEIRLKIIEIRDKVFTRNFNKKEKWHKIQVSKKLEKTSFCSLLIVLRIHIRKQLRLALLLQVKMKISWNKKNLKLLKKTISYSKGLFKNKIDLEASLMLNFYLLKNILLRPKSQLWNMIWIELSTIKILLWLLIFYKKRLKKITKK